MSQSISEKAQSPVIIPPESLSKNWISKRTFNPSKNITFSFEPKTIQGDKELTFGIFLVDSESTKLFGATTVKGGLYDYSTKGEVAEGLLINDTKYQTTIDGNTYDILLDHVYPENEQDLLNNQNPFNVFGYDNPFLFSIFFDTTKSFYKTILDSFGNQYFDPIIPIDIISEEEVTDIDNYQAPMFIQVRDKIYVIDLIIDNIPLSILDFKSHTIKFDIEDNGKFVTCSILKPNTQSYIILFKKEINSRLDEANFLRFGFGITSPVISYDENKKAAEKPADLLRIFNLQALQARD